MKKYLFILLTLVVTSFAFVSCSSDDEDDNQYTSAIVGTWKLTEVRMSETGSYITWPFKTTYASFDSDGTYYGYGYFGTGSGTWSLKGNTIKTYVDGKLYVSYDILSVTSTDAELKMTADDASLWIKCKKQ